MLSQPGVAQVREAACQAAKANFPKVVVEVQERIKRYSECVNNSDGSENCSSEFLRLRTAHGSLEVVTMQHRTYCPG